MVGAPAATQAAQRHLAGMLGALEPRGPDGFSGIWDPSGRAALGIGLLRVADGPAEAVVHTNEEETLRMVCDGQV
ncbi:hypothetical protein AAEQ96_10865, partial [Pseudomonas aeruginosa]